MRKELEAASLAADQALTKLQQERAREKDPDRLKVLALKVQAAAVERDKCLMALFQTDMSNSRG